MSRGCRHEGAPYLDAVCAGCVAEAEVYARTFGRLTFHGRVAPASTERAVELLRRHSFWAAADLLEAACAAWNENQGKG